MSPQARDLVRALLQLDPRRRLTASAALKHPWMAACVMPDNQKLRAECAYLISEQPEDDLRDDVLNELGSFGVSADVAKECVTQRKHNGMATLYYLLLASHAQKQLTNAEENEGGRHNIGRIMPRSTPPQEYPTPTSSSPEVVNPTTELHTSRRYHRPRSAGIR